MVTAIIESKEVKISELPHISIEEWMQNPPENTEWVDGELIEKNGITLKHSRIQLKLGTCWRNYPSFVTLGRVKFRQQWNW
ncbi:MULTISPECIES: hypothetical protein [Kamptonema]|uniref:hypothetical protein n=1 Tax=Kamptonema TaxID=1501433 RepID=UPI0001DAC591|nr:MULTISPECIES: hypothetical protein [Kamptonema]CBN56737.1 hypothetical protein OSCI_3160011 [Kamptonema sp. PCC 6506]